MFANTSDTIGIAFTVAMLVLSYGSPVILLVATWLVGREIERRHIASLELREADVGKRIIVTSERRLPPGVAARQGAMVSGSVVVGTDYFKRFLAAWRSLVGGRVNSVQPVLMRARREAILRMLEKADAQGANFVVNVRLETATIGNSHGGKNNFAMCEVLAYGTAVKMGYDHSPYGPHVDAGS